MAKKSSLLQVVVTSNGQRIGTLTCEQFRQSQRGAPSNAFLQTLVEKFNEYKTAIGEPERVHTELRK